MSTGKLYYTSSHNVINDVSEFINAATAFICLHLSGFDFILFNPISQ